MPHPKLFAKSRRWRVDEIPTQQQKPAPDDCVKKHRKRQRHEFQVGCPYVDWGTIVTISSVRFRVCVKKMELKLVRSYVLLLLLDMRWV